MLSTATETRSSAALRLLTLDGNLVPRCLQIHSWTSTKLLVDLRSALRHFFLFIQKKTIVSKALLWFSEKKCCCCSYGIFSASWETFLVSVIGTHVQNMRHMQGDGDKLHDWLSNVTPPPLLLSLLYSFTLPSSLEFFLDMQLCNNTDLLCKVLFHRRPLEHWNRSPNQIQRHGASPSSRVVGATLLWNNVGATWHRKESFCWL